MLASSSRTCTRRVAQLCLSHSGESSVAGNYHFLCCGLRLTLLSGNWTRRHASAVANPSHQQNASPPITHHEASIPLGLRNRPEFKSNSSHQATMTQTTQARFEMRLLDSSENGRYHETLAIAAEMKEAGIRPQLSTYTALIHAAAREGCWLDAWAMFDDMITAGIKPSVGIFNWLILVIFYPML